MPRKAPWDESLRDRRVNLGDVRFGSKAATNGITEGAATIPSEDVGAKRSLNA